MTIATAFFVNGFFFFSEYSNEGELLSIYKRLFDLYSDSLSISYKELDAIHQSLSTISLLQEQQNAEAESSALEAVSNFSEDTHQHLLDRKGKSTNRSSRRAHASAPLGKKVKVNQSLQQYIHPSIHQSQAFPQLPFPYSD